MAARISIRAGLADAGDESAIGATTSVPTAPLTLRQAPARHGDAGKRVSAASLAEKWATVGERQKRSTEKIV